MNAKHSKWINNRQKWLHVLEHGLRSTNENDIVVHQDNVAFAFPSKDPNPHSFDRPLIDREAFIPWAKSLGWKVALVLESTPKKDRHRPHVRFTRIQFGGRQVLHSVIPSNLVTTNE